MTNSKKAIETHKEVSQIKAEKSHCYLVSYRAGGIYGHKHIYAGEKLAPPQGTIEICKVIAEGNEVEKEDVIITSMFYFGHVVIVDKDGEV